MYSIPETSFRRTGRRALPWVLVLSFLLGLCHQLGLVNQLDLLVQLVLLAHKFAP